MEELSQQLMARIKSPIFGYFFVSFIALNWDPIFYLFFHTVSVPLRINYFKEYVDFYSAFLYPLLISVAYSIAYPWMNLAIVRATTHAMELKNNLSIDADHRTTIKKSELEQARSELLKIREERILERAVVDEKINQIEDENTRQELKVQLTEIRNVDTDKTTKNPLNFPEFDSDLQGPITNLLVAMAYNRSKIGRAEIASQLGFSPVKNEVIINKLITNRYIDLSNVTNGDTKYILSDKAKRVLVDKKLID